MARLEEVFHIEETIIGSRTGIVQDRLRLQYLVSFIGSESIDDVLTVVGVLVCMVKYVLVTDEIGRAHV